MRSRAGRANRESKAARHEPIAIVGMGCVLPGGCDSPEAFWRALIEARDLVTEVPAERWSLGGFYSADPAMPAKSVSRWGGFLTNIREFDAAFFGISPREASLVDPQQRLLLQVAWEALEDAGVAVEGLKGSPTGVFIGISQSDYNDVQKLGPMGLDVHTATGGALSIAANRISHRFDLRGPSVAVDTACSSAMVAFDAACRSIWSGDCSLALAGGVNVMLTPNITITFSRASMLSPDGRCKAFDARANGYVRGEGAGILVLKPLSAALAAGDRVHAVVRATFVNQDGHTSTITVPNGEAQEAMLREACRRAGIAPTAVDYVEAHGTGTAVGDPIEAGAIGKVFGRGAKAKARCLVGSAKTNVGHLEPAAGVAGLIKAVMSLREGVVPPNLHFETPNPRIPFDELGIQVPTRPTPWGKPAHRRHAAVNSFGFGGTNACAILQGWAQPRAAAEATAERPLLVPLSAASPTALATLAQQTADAVAHDGAALDDVAATLAHRRSHLDHRLVALAGSTGELVVALSAHAAGEKPEAMIVGRAGATGPLAFVFTGQGAQWWAMGRGLLGGDPVFRGAVEACDALFKPLAGWSIVEAMLADEAVSRMNETAVAQPATFALQVGLAARWKQWGIVPAAVAGHSIGEIAAAHVCGALSLEDAVAVVFNRSRLQERSRGRGGMAAIGETPERVATLLEPYAGRLEIAAVNGPTLVTVAGDKDALEEMLAALKQADGNVFRQLLRVDYAFHSHHMDAFEPELVASLQSIRPKRPVLPMISTVTGKPVGKGELDAGYWWRNMRRPVLFHDAVRHLVDEGLAAFLELGPHPALTGPVTATLEERGRAGFIVPSLRRGTDDATALRRSAADLHVRGVALDWGTLVPRRPSRAKLPRTPWEKKSFWTDSEEARAERYDEPVHPLLGYRMHVARPTWQSEVSARLQPFLVDHQIDGSLMLPAAAFIEMMLAAARDVFGDGPWEAETIAFHEALTLGTDESALLQTVLEPERGAIQILSRIRDREKDWTLRATARIRARPTQAPPADPWSDADLPPEVVGSERLYRHLRREGCQYGPAFQGVRTLWRSDGHALGRIELPAASLQGHLLHPALLDSCFHLIRGFRGFGEADATAVTLPVGLRRLRLFKPAPANLYGRARQVHLDAGRILADITVFDEGGGIVASLDGFECRRWPRVAAATAMQSEHYRERWIAEPRPEGAPPAQGDSPGGWLVFADGGGIAAAVADRLAAEGHGVTLVGAGDSSQASDGRVEVRPDSIEDIDRILAAARQAQPPLTAILHFRGVDPPAGDPLAAQQRTSLHLLRLIQRLTSTSPEDASTEDAPRLWVFSAEAWQPDGAADPEGDALGLAAATLSGMCRTARTEYAALACTLVDIARANPSIDEIVAELLADTAEPEVLLRPSGRYVNRIERVVPEDVPPATMRRTGPAAGTPFALTLPHPGAVDGLRLAEMDRPKAGPGEVVIAVRAAALNFRDVMAATGLLPPAAEAGDAWRALGLECAGDIVEVGEGVTSFRPGDAVAATVRGCFVSHVAVPQTLVSLKPAALSYAQAATLPTAFLTAWHALVTQGRLAAGERVLITAATGGVGQAAIQVVRLFGGEVLATAGSPEKRAYLRSLGVEHVFDSRSLDFADEVMAATGGAGVDLVLNSQPGPFIEKGIAVLAPYGRFLEIGKRDIYADTPVGLFGLRNNISFIAIDLARMAIERQTVLQRAMGEVLAEMERGRLHPVPVELFPLSRAAEAFRRMLQARHMGKIVLDFDEPDLAVAVRQDRPLSLRPDASYLVTGGLGGFGLTTARWLAAHGARHLVLVGRSGASTPEAQAALAEMRAAGVDVREARADVSDAQAVDALVRSIDPAVPLRGVVHAAMVLDDGFIPQLDEERFTRVLRPKIMGAWNLHSATAGCPLDFFVLYSSIASALTGSAGQANYAAANRYLDALAQYRRRHGLPGMSIAWGAIADAGYLVRNENVARYITSAGIACIPAAEALDALGRLMLRDIDAVSFAGLDWTRLSTANATLATSPRCAHLIDRSAAQAGHGQARAEVLAAEPSARTAILVRFLREKVGAVLRADPATVDADRPLAEFGLDSLTSFELKNRVEGELGVSVPVGKFLQRPSVNTLAAAFLERIEASGAESATTAGMNGADPDDEALSHGQEALWFLHRLAPDSPAYNLVYCVRVRPAPDIAAMQQAFQIVVQRHRSLRAIFPDEGGLPLQRFLDPESLAVEVRDARHLSEAALRQTLAEHASAPFDLATGPVVRLHVFRRPRGAVVLMLKVHHIVADAWSLSVVLNDLFAAYFAVLDGVDAKLPALRHGYSDYVRWNRALTRGPEGAEHLAFWRSQLADAPPALDLPTDRPRPALPDGRGAAVPFTVPPEIVSRIEALATGEGTTLFATLLAAYQVLLQRLSGQSDIVVGAPVAGRTRPEFEQVVGYLVNPLPIRGRLDASASFRTTMRAADDAVRAALEHQDHPFPLLVQALQPARDPSRSPVFQAAFTMERSAVVDTQGFAVTLLNVPGPKLVLRDHVIEAVALQRNHGQFDIGFTVEEFDGRLYGIADYRTDLFDATTVRGFVDRYVRLLAAFVEHPDTAIGAVALDPQRRQRAASWRADEFPDAVEAVLAVARAHPDRAAVNDGRTRLTYRGLETRARALARALTARGIGAGSRVGIAIERSADLPVAVLGTLMAGAAFVPLDPAYPDARISAMVTDAAPALVLGDLSLQARLPQACALSRLEDLIDEAERLPDAARLAAVRPDAAAYVIYTSGSTGQPAGVEVPRRALANLLGAAGRLGLVGESDQLLALTTLSFDIALLELLLPLSVGASVEIADAATARDGRRLAQRLASGGITVAQATPATWLMLVEAGWAGGDDFTVLCGGERLPADLAEALLQRAGTVWNLYGPTETTIWSTAARLAAGAPVTIGRPIANTLCRVLDDRLNPVPVGATGELCIGGAGLASGYRNRPELTAERFVEVDGTRLFRTGDIVRQAADGTLAFIGRRDHQLKLRGFRIEPGEIEAALREQPDIAAAAVAMLGDGLAERRLAAFLVPAAGAAIDAAALRTRLAKLLPPHMVPTQWHVVAALPQTPNGKLDRKALPALAAGRSADPAARSAPRDRDEALLVRIAAGLLGVKTLGIDDDFYERGGSSLLMVQLVARASEALGVDLGVADVVGNATVAGLATRAKALRVRDATGDALPAEPLPGAAASLDWRPLALRRAAGGIGPIDAAALAYLPDELAGSSGLSRRQIAATLFEGRPHWYAVEETPLGRIALVTVPAFAADLFAAPDAALAQLRRGIELAAGTGARCVALTGLIPAASDLGRALVQEGGSVALTTGHATTAASMVLSIEELLNRTGRRIEDERVAFVGLGSIGQATLRLMVDQLAHPASIKLCDVPAKRPLLETLAQELRQVHGFHGQIVVATAGGKAADAAYAATLMIGATSAPDVVDIGRLAPGTLLVDDSFPPCFDVAAAAQRLHDRGDILFTAGGFVRAPAPLRRHLGLPPGAVRYAGRPELRRALAGRGGDAITGCILSGLLSLVRPDLAPQLGPVELEASRAHLTALRELGFAAASLGIGGFAPSESAIAAFRQRYGALAAA